jgi:methylated-DNA-[protein]-cysteine S-methyltransferase
LQVFEEIKKIPKGQVITYKELAKRIGRPNAYRAVANACGKNNDPKNIPCHRVIRSDGRLGGYSLDGGIEMKKRLINNEK